MKLIEKVPSLFGILFDLTDKPSKGEGVGDGLRRAVQRWGANQLADLVETGSWDAIVHTHFLAPELIAALRRRGRTAAPQLTVVTDYDAHRIWVHDPTERYCVASPLAGASLRAHGVSASAIVLTGIPVMPAYSTPVDEDAVRRAFGLSGGYPVVLHASGGHGVGPVEETFRALLAATIPMEFVIVCGRNEAARSRLSTIRPPSRHRVRVLGFTDRMRDLMAVADLLVTKPGGLTVSEALACGLPMALISPIPGQEVRNADYLLENGAAVKANSPVALTGKIEELLSSEIRLKEMRRKAKALGHPRAAFAIARRTLELARGRSSIVAQDEEARAVVTAPFLLNPWVVPGLRA
ncbi:MAG: galactosyldiacylglycerol synthase [Elusimicrobia bacterium CG11_big_fil_rev_8_21_14_0_20_64_6]|nr:MAG: galactosyldiacylglycerol synthase [Elusimicrobia bacterium CG11_big_fil_rev_8_21_14_0_20_64_6]